MNRWKEKVNKWILKMQFTTKEKRTIIVVLTGTVVCTVILFLMDHQPLDVLLQRNTYGEGDRIEQLQLSVEGEDVDEEKIEIEVEISEQSYTDEELQVVFAECIEELDVCILGENVTTDMVYYDLNLVAELPEYSVEIEWKWSPYEVLNIYGEIQEEHITDEGVLVELVGTLSYGEEEMQYCQYLMILPAPQTKVEELVEEIQQYIDAENKATLTAEELELPSEMEEYRLVWYEKPSRRYMGILLMGVGIVTFLIYKKDLERKNAKQFREQQMLRDYPQIIYIFALYIGAGMTVKNAWKRMVQESDCERFAYREMKKSYIEMENGISEIECYETFGKRCGLRCYQRLGLLFSQNVRKGTKGMIDILERESIESFEERKNQVKAVGEKTGTKLLLPMFLMLVVVLVIVIVPAFVSLQI